MSERFFTDKFIRVQKNQEKSNAAGLVMKASRPDSPRLPSPFGLRMQCRRRPEDDAG